jgi:protein ImuB
MSLRTSVRKDIACIAVPRYALVVACKGRRDLLDKPIALTAKTKAGISVVELSRAAERQGVARGMAWRRALAICPDLHSALEDPVSAAEQWERLVGQLEEIGAAVESQRSGEAFFSAGGLRGLHGGKLADVVVAAQRAVEMSVRGAVAPARFASFIAAVIRPGRSAVLKRQSARVVSEVDLGDFLAALPISALTVGPGLTPGTARALVLRLADLGFEQLGQLASTPADHIADRFGTVGLQAHQMARGEDRELRPRSRHDELEEEIEFPDAIAGQQLEAGLEQLVARLLSSPQRKERTILAVCLSAHLVNGASWTSAQVFGKPTASKKTIYGLLQRRLTDLPSSAASLKLKATQLGPRPADQLRLPCTNERAGPDRLETAIRQIQALQGPGAMLRIREAEGDSRIPERRAILTPFI